MEPWVRAFLIVLGVLALFTQPGPFLNDEVGQMAALTSLADGSLLVQPDLPEGYEIMRYWAGNVVPDPDEPPRSNAGSTMLTVLALPLLGILRVLDIGFGPTGAVAFLAAAAVGAGMWAWRRTALPAAAVASAVFLGGVIMQVQRMPPSSPYLEAGAIQFVNMAFHAFASALIYDLLRTRVRQPGLATALYAFGTPALFWGLNLKYHAIAIALAAIVLWLYQEGHRTRPLRTGLAFLVAGFAVWNHVPNGILVVASLGLMATPTVLLGLRPFVQRAAAGAAGFGLGLLPEVVDRAVHRAIGQRERFPVDPEAGHLRWAVWNDPGGPVDAFWQMVVWPDRTTTNIGNTIPLLALVPLVVLVVWAYRGGSRIGMPLKVWPAVHFVVLLLLFGRGVFQNGAGFDLRQASTLWPFLALPLAMALDQVDIGWRQVARAGALIASGMTIIVWMPMFVARQLQGGSVLMRGRSGELADPLWYVGLLGAAAVLAVWIVPRLHKWRSHAVAAAVAWSFLVQFLLQLGPARGWGDGEPPPFIVWPMAGLEYVVERLLMESWWELGIVAG